MGADMAAFGRGFVGRWSFSKSWWWRCDECSSRAPKTRGVESTEMDAKRAMLEHVKRAHR